MGKSTIIAIFNSYLYVYQRIYPWRCPLTMKKMGGSADQRLGLMEVKSIEKWGSFEDSQRGRTLGSEIIQFFEVQEF
jgi:hypothetical protein